MDQGWSIAAAICEVSQLRTQCLLDSSLLWPSLVFLEIFSHFSSLKKKVLPPIVLYLPSQFYFFFHGYAGEHVCKHVCVCTCMRVCVHVCLCVHVFVCERETLCTYTQSRNNK